MRTQSESYAVGASARTVFVYLKQRWRRFLAAPSGTRFQAHYRRQHAHRGLVRTMVAIGAGLLLIALGIVLLVLPGPGLLIGAIGAALLAGESLLVARALDWIDRQATRLWRRLRRHRG